MATEQARSSSRAVLLSGGSGWLGQMLTASLGRDAVPVLRLVRRLPRDAAELQWNPAPGGVIEDVARLEGLAAAVHLSGASVADRRWTPAWKRVMRSSRVDSTRLLAETLTRLQRPPAVLLCASAIGFYGSRGDEVLDEDSPRGEGFFPELCAAWEQAAAPAIDAGIRVVHLRLGIVLGSHGGALARLLPLFRLGLGGRLGSGSQWMSWISATDAVRAFRFAMATDSLRGAVNVAAPEPVTNRQFTRELAQAVHRPALLPAPALALRLAFGEMADAALLASARVLPRRLEQAGFVFAQPALPDALRSAVADEDGMQQPE